jgi:hypothetical protein
MSMQASIIGKMPKLSKFEASVRFWRYFSMSKSKMTGCKNVEQHIVEFHLSELLYIF